MPSVRCAGVTRIVAASLAQLSHLCRASSMLTTRSVTSGLLRTSSSSSETDAADWARPAV